MAMMMDGYGLTVLAAAWGSMLSGMQLIMLAAAYLSGLGLLAAIVADCLPGVLKCR